jgi:two-component system, LuxR family, sensor kinase FixL
MRMERIPQLVIAGLYLAGHVLLDWLSFMHPYGAFGITPWNPSTGLSLVFMLLWGPRAAPVVFLALMSANSLVRGMPVPLWIAAAEAVVRTAVYSTAMSVLLRPSLKFNPSLPSMRDLFLLLVVASVSSAAIACAYVGLLLWSDLISSVDAASAVLRCWVGDMNGIAVVAPFGLLATAGAPLIRFSLETTLQMASSIALAVWVAYVFAEQDQLQLFYFLFLPLTWIAVRAGIEGVSVALLLVQAGLLIAVHFVPGRSIDVMDFQARMLILAVTGLVAGVLVSERRRTEAQLRVNQNALSHLSRLSSMGELAVTIAHEINSPLSAARTYTRMVAETLQGETLKDRGTVEIAQKAAVQISRAADVVRRLRTLARMGHSELAPTSIARIVREARDLARTDIDRENIVLKTELDTELPDVLADRLQIEQVLLNLIRNSVEAIGGETRLRPGQISIVAVRQPNFVELSVRDNGPGFSSAFGGDPPPPLSTTKPDGLGIGLSLCRSIAEAHGGTLSIRSSRDGATVSVLLPVAGGDAHG